MEQLETGNIGFGNTSTLATLNNDRFLIIDDKELYLIGVSIFCRMETTCLKQLALGARANSPVPIVQSKAI